MHADSLAVYVYDLQYSNNQTVLEIPPYFTRCQTWSNVTPRFCAKKKKKESYEEVISTCAEYRYALHTLIEGLWWADLGDLFLKASVSLSRCRSPKWPPRKIPSIVPKGNPFCSLITALHWQLNEHDSCCCNSSHLMNQMIVSV